MLKTLAVSLFAVALTVGACAPKTTNTESSVAGTAAALPASTAKDASVTARGIFVGKSDHVTTGHAAIARAGTKWVLILEDDFTFDGAPDPHVALGNDGYDKNARLALLSSNDGKQVYEIPAGLNVGRFNEVWIWCKKFGVPLGVAKLTLT
jgi:hypothetical protein